MILPKFGDLLLILEKPGEFITHRKKKLEFLGKNQPLRFTRKFKKSVKLPTLSMSRRHYLILSKAAYFCSETAFGLGKETHVTVPKRVQKSQ